MIGVGSWRVEGKMRIAIRGMQEEGLVAFIVAQPLAGVASGEGVHGLLLGKRKSFGMMSSKLAQAPPIDVQMSALGQVLRIVAIVPLRHGLAGGFQDVIEPARANAVPMSGQVHFMQPAVRVNFADYRRAVSVFPQRLRHAAQMRGPLRIRISPGAVALTGAQAVPPSEAGRHTQRTGTEGVGESRALRRQPGKCGRPQCPHRPALEKVESVLVIGNQKHVRSIHKALRVKQFTVVDTPFKTIETANYFHGCF